MLRNVMEQLDRALAENDLLKRAIASGSDHSLVCAAMAVINRGGPDIVRQFVDELTKPKAREAIAADLGISE